MKLVLIVISNGKGVGFSLEYLYRMLTILHPRRFNARPGKITKKMVYCTILFQTQMNSHEIICLDNLPVELVFYKINGGSGKWGSMLY